MNVSEAINNLNQRFTWTQDARDKWTILTDDGPIRGDCEDYALTLGWLICDRSLTSFWVGNLTCRFVLWHCRSPTGEPHVIMWVRGHGWIDNISRRFITRDELRAQGYRLNVPFIGFFAILKYVVSQFIGRR